MKILSALIRRNTKLFFRDKGMFFTSLITPLILLVLYVTFLADVYRDSFAMGLGESQISQKLLNNLVGGQLFSSLLAVCTVTVAFCSNMLMVQDKVTGARDDFAVTPVKKSVLALGYYLSTVIVTLAICVIAALCCLFYMGIGKWFYAPLDLCLIFADIFLLVMFGVALSSVINHFLSSQGQISAVGTVISAGYGFLCGAYMPISQFGSGLQKLLGFLPGTYGTVLLRNHTMNPVIGQMVKEGLPQDAASTLQDVVDCHFYFGSSTVSIPTMYIVLCTTVILLILGYIALQKWGKGKG
ncbi:MAG: ABC transporter permease [Ruminococcaceae bacterium]|nr:ABC transporter permease [Oscillospiraceae bacterium]